MIVTVWPVSLSIRSCSSTSCRLLCLAVSKRRLREKAMDGKQRADIALGAEVAIVQKQDQRSGRRTEGRVREILTNSPSHPHGIKVRLESGQIGRVKQIMQRGG